MNQNLQSKFVKFITNEDAFKNQFILGALLIKTNEYNDTISFVSGLSSNQVSYLKAYIKYFGYDIPEFTSWEELYSEVNNKLDEISKELERLRQERWNAWYNKLWRNLKLLGSWIIASPFFIVLIVFDLLSYIPVALIKFFTFRRKENNTYINNNYNTINYSEGVTNNKSNQVNKIYINQNKGEGIKLIADTKIGLAEKLANYILISKSKEFNDRFITSLFNLGVKIKSIPYLNDKLKYNVIFAISIIIVLLLATGAPPQIALSTLIIFIAGCTITVTHKSCNKDYSNSNKFIPPNITKIEPDSLAILPTIDSLNIEKNNSLNTNATNENQPNEYLPIVNYEDYKSQIQRYFISNSSCIPLSEIGTKQINFLSSQDLINHTSQDYYIDASDGLYYLHVVVYNTIQEAAFQIHYINTNTTFKAKILSVLYKNGQELFAVVIGDGYSGIEINDMCDMKTNWLRYCSEQENKIGVYYNG